MNPKRICLVTSGHPPLDDRIFWKFSKSLSENGFSVSIICSTTNINLVKDNIQVTGFDGISYSSKNKIVEFYKLIDQFSPHLIICSEMIPVFAALKYRRKNKNAKIILDITELYPENVAFKFKGLKRWLKYVQLVFPYIYSLNRIDQLIIGERTKQNRYKFLSPLKQKTIIGYYPILKFFKYKKPDLSKDELVFGYAGVVTFERGIQKLLDSTIAIAKIFPQKKITLLIFGRFTNQNEETLFRQKATSQKIINVIFENWTDYDKMSSVIERMDICFDLRERNFIYNNSLPIKLFEYMACGKPFIFSDVKPIRGEIDFDKFGFLVNPDQESEIISAIQQYLNNPELAIKHSSNSRSLIEGDKNWKNESKKLIEIITKLLA